MGRGGGGGGGVSGDHVQRKKTSRKPVSVGG